MGLATGFATGYYLGARAGRHRYDQINRSLAKLRRSEAFEQATDRAKSVVEEGVEKALSVVGGREGNGQGDGQSYEPGPGPDLAEPQGIIVPGESADLEGVIGLIVPEETGPPESPPGSPPGLGGYSSSR